MPEPEPSIGDEPSCAGIVDIVIVNWNSGTQLQACVRSIARWHAGAVRTVIVVDNASTDRSFVDLDPCGLALVMIDAGGNLGFGRACNLGAGRATAPLLLFLNPDAELRPDALGRAVRFIDGSAAARVGVVGIKLTDDEDRVQHHTTVRPRPTTIFTHEQRASRFDHLDSRPVHHVIGAFYLIRLSLFQELGGFDERFFMYLEDLDLSDRVHAAGWAVYYLAEAEAFHRGGGTSRQVKARRLFYSTRSRLQYSRKHFSTGAFLGILAATLVLEPVLRIGRAAMRRSLPEVRETLNALARVYASVPALLRERR